MKLRLLTRWNGYMSGDTVSLSDARAEYLESEGIGRVIDRPAPVEEVKEEPIDASQAEEPVEEVKEAKPKPKK